MHIYTILSILNCAEDLYRKYKGRFYVKKLVTFLGVSSLLLTACGGEQSEDAESTDSSTEEDTEVVEEEEAEQVKDEVETESEEEDSSLTQQVGDTIEAEGGTRTIVGQVENINETQSSGPFEVTLLHSQLSQFQPAEDFVDIFGGEDLVLLTFQVEVTNNSEDTNTIHPDQGIAVTDNGNQVDAEIFLSDDVGGDFHGEVTKTGDVFFLYDGNADDVSSARYIINSGHDENFDNFGEDIEFTVEF